MKVAEPLLSGSVVAAPPSTLKDTLPVGVLTTELTVTVTLPFALYVTVGALINVDVGARFTFCVMAGDVDVKKFVSPM